jgi:hypothetical protein
MTEDPTKAGARPPPFEFKPAQAKDFTCPKCRKMDHVYFAEYVLRQIKLKEVESGVAVFDVCDDNVIWEVNKDQRLYCSDCDEEWPLPADTDIDFR